MGENDACHVWYTKTLRIAEFAGDEELKKLFMERWAGLKFDG